MNEQKNLLLAIVVSLLILLIFQYFFPTENNSDYTENSPISLQNEDDLSVSLPAKREDVLKEEKRVYRYGIVEVQ